MTSILQAIILGIIQGITEWLPISSSGHLVIFKHLFGLQTDVFLDVMLHYGSLLVIIIVFYKDILKIILSIFTKRFRRYRKLFYFMIIGSVPIAILGYSFHDIFESLFSDIFIVAIALLITGLLLFLTRFKTQQITKNIKSKQLQRSKNNTLKSLTIGIIQAVAIIPGISRSGSTISTSILLGIGRKESARFSFLLAIPALLGAVLYETHTSPNLVFNQSYLLPLLIGTIVSVIVGYISLKWLLKVINKGKLYKFAYYCWIVGIIILVVSLI